MLLCSLCNAGCFALTAHAPQASFNTCSLIIRPPASLLPPNLNPLPPQVHEKSILLPLMPITALAAWEPDAAIWGPVVAAFSMYPLLERDGLALPYAGAIAMYLAVMGKLRDAAFSGSGTPQRAAGWLAAAGQGAIWGGGAAALALHAARALLPPPERLPWLWDRAFISLAFVYVVAGMCYFNWRQWAQPASGGIVSATPNGVAPRGAAGSAAAAAALGRRGGPVGIGSGGGASPQAAATGKIKST
jgi:hypothetical protein